eukprot:12277681-Prorocentrum_lima.AAC.1
MSHVTSGTPVKEGLYQELAHVLLGLKMFPWRRILALDQEVSLQASLSARSLITYLQGTFNYFCAIGRV